MTQTLPFEPAGSAPTIQLHHGNCLEVMPTLAPGSVAMVFADLPYGILRHHRWDVLIDLDLFWSSVKEIQDRITKVVFTANATLMAKLILSNESEFKYDLVWKKHISSNFMMGKRRPLCVHEHILLFAQHQGAYNPQMRDENLRQNKRKFKPPTRLSSWYAGKHKAMASKQGAMYPISVIETKESKKGNIHPTQKPVALLEWLIKTYTNPGDTVLDPVFGSCTTGVACMRTGRNFVGIEKDAGYFEVGRKRIAEEQARLGYEVTV